MSEPNNNPPAPTPASAEKKNSWQEGKSPLNVRPRGEQIPFMEKLIAEKGSAQAAISWCIDRARAAGAGKAADAVAESEIQTLQDEIKRLKAAKPPAQHSGITGLKEKAQLDRIMKAKSLGEAEAIDWSLRYSKQAYL